MATGLRVRPRRGRSNNLGIGLAIVAGLTAIGFAQWPIAPPQARGDMGALWGLSVWIVGFLCIAAAFLVDQYRLLAKSLLTFAALFLVGSAFVNAEIMKIPRLTWLAVALDLVPAAIALVAAVLIGPVTMSDEEIAARMGTLPPLDDPAAGEPKLDRAA